MGVNGLLCALSNVACIKHDIGNLSLTLVASKFILPLCIDQTMAKHSSSTSLKISIFSFLVGEGP